MSSQMAGRGDHGGSGGLPREEFARRFSDCAARLRCIALAIVGDRAQAEDLVQEAAVVALSKLDRFEPGTSFAAWMSQIVRFVSLNEGRRRTRRETHATDPVTLDARPEGRVEMAGAPLDRRGRLARDQEAFDDAVIKALSQIEEKARACLLLRTCLDLSYREIAELLELPEGTAMSHVHRSRMRLREELRGEYAPAGGDS